MSEIKKMHVKTGDTVVVISGPESKSVKADKNDANQKNKAKMGKVLKTLPKEGRVVVEGVNMISKHQKARGAQQQGGIIKMEAPIDSSNVMLYCPTCKAPRKAEIKVLDDGKNTRIRVCKKCKESFDK